MAQTVKNPQCKRPGFNPWVGKISRRMAWQPTPVFLPGGYPWTEEPGGLQFKGSTKSQTQLSDHAQHNVILGTKQEIIHEKTNKQTNLPHLKSELMLFTIY